MQNLVKNKRDVYIASKLANTNPIQYSEPVAYKLNVYPISSEIGLYTLGTSYTEYMRCKTNITTIKEGDGAYITNAPETEFNILGKNLEYIVTSVKQSLNEVEILFKRKVGV